MLFLLILREIKNFINEENEKLIHAKCVSNLDYNNKKIDINAIENNKSNKENKINNNKNIKNKENLINKTANNFYPKNYGGVNIDISKKI